MGLGGRVASAIERLQESDREITALAHALETLRWDQETYLPQGGIGERALQISLLQGIIHDRVTSTEQKELFAACGMTEAAAANAEEAADITQAFLREAFRRYNRQTKVPKTLVTQLAMSQSLAQAEWIKARKVSSFAMFAPHLENLLGLLRQYAECQGYKDEIYDALLDEYEPWTKTKDIASVFEKLKSRLVPLYKNILGKKTAKDDEVLKRSFPVEKQREFCNKLLAMMNFDLDRGRMDVSAHPFTTTLGGDDIRLTTRYNEHFFPSAIFGTIHEAGHGLYEQGMARELRGTILANGASLGIHESQSRFWENLIGRSRGFWKACYAEFARLFPKALLDIPLERFYRAINSVSPSLIRVEADEVTYNLHIILRFTLERRLLDGSLAVQDLPEAWNRESANLLGIKPPTDREGVLQDVHWSMGAIGYFPTYSLGNLYSAQFFDTMKKALPGIEYNIANGKLKPVREWLLENIHRHGSMYSADQLVKRVTGKPLDPSYFLTYIQKKYGEIYDL
ncbi:MAG: carboxypeptidase M32 [Spirochaetaceae bacterium]|nr:MAG: carboxypeptidase M32 [Spirochaetaceae bacterium]